MRLLFVARSIDRMAGGVERMVISIMNAMIARGHEVSLFTWDMSEAISFYPMAPGIRWFRLNMGEPQIKAGFRLVLARLSIVRRMVKEFKPDVIVCFQGGSFLAMQLYTAGLKIPLIAAERTAPTLYDHAGTPRQRFIEHQMFRFATRIAVQFERYFDYYPSYLRSLLVTIPNPVAEADVKAQPAVPNENGRWLLLSVGRLGYQKNYSVLIEAFASIATRFRDWDLRIVGSGEERPALEALIAARSDIANRVSLPGVTTDIHKEYVAAHLFCLPSRWEGFPNALAEALAHGVPAVGFANCAGVADLVRADLNGILAPGNGDPKALAGALAAVMADPALRARLGVGAVESVASYRPDDMVNLWEDTLRACVTA
jgi:glycosyltransferase involved in cell wall biosynthesis